MGVDMQIGNDRLLLDLDEESCLDIGSLMVDGVQFAPGGAVPDDGDARILHALHGFLFTCGPDHIRHPEPVDGVEGRAYPLHGSLCGNRAEITSTGESDCVTATIRIQLADGGAAEIRRTWRLDDKAMTVALEDQLVNTGKTVFSPMLMYHMNIASTLLDDATMLAGPTFGEWAGSWRFGDGESKVFCVPAQSADGRTCVQCGPIAAIGGRSLQVWFDADTLPHLQMWRNQKGDCRVLGIEPASHPWQKRPKLVEMGLMVPLAPGQSRTYRLGFAFE
jgi:hypothetical protein